MRHGSGRFELRILDRLAITAANFSRLPRWSWQEQAARALFF
jgi:hypothetical protein